MNKGKSKSAKRVTKLPHVRPVAVRAVASESAESLHGFEICIFPSPTVTPDAQDRFVQRYDNFLSDHRLQWEGKVLRRFISSPERDLSVSDQVNLLSWMMNDNIRPNVQLGALRFALGTPDSDLADQWVWAWHADPALAALLLLYRQGRIRASLFWQILTGHPADPSAIAGVRS
jgi:hypothetical protein